MNASSVRAPSASDPWVESGAMVYVAITVATVSAVIMCCTYFVTHHPFVRAWCLKESRYNTVYDEEVEIQLTADTDEPSSPKESKSSAFTLGDSGEESSEGVSEGVSEDEETHFTDAV